jgi:hypothetical protein
MRVLNRPLGAEEGPRRCRRGRSTRRSRSCVIYGTPKRVLPPAAPWGRSARRSKTPELRRLKELESENLRLKKLVADLSLDNAMLKELAEGNF